MVTLVPAVPPKPIKYAPPVVRPVVLVTFRRKEKYPLGPAVVKGLLMSSVAVVDPATKAILFPVDAARPE